MHVIRSAADGLDRLSRGDRLRVPAPDALTGDTIAVTITLPPEDVADTSQSSDEYVTETHTVRIHGTDGWGAWTLYLPDGPEDAITVRWEREAHKPDGVYEVDAVERPPVSDNR